MIYNKGSWMFLRKWSGLSEVSSELITRKIENLKLYRDYVYSISELLYNLGEFFSISMHFIVNIMQKLAKSHKGSFDMSQVQIYWKLVKIGSLFALSYKTLFLKPWSWLQNIVLVLCTKLAWTHLYWFRPLFISK